MYKTCMRTLNLCRAWKVVR